MKAEDIYVSYEDAIKIAPPQLREKIIHSVELIRKGEKYALMYDPEDGYYNTFSGGKDSQALYHIMKMAGVKFKTHMSLTSVDPGDVIRFVKAEYPSVIRHKPKMSMFQAAVEHKILPTMRVRWCCADFKESAGAGKVTLIGIRAEESTRRAKRHEVEVSNKNFSGNIDEFEQWSDKEIEKKRLKLKRKLNEDEFSVESDNEIRCINGKDSILVSPIFRWTERDVWYFLDNIIHAPHCSLYDEGYTRIGCILCPMSTHKSKLRDVERFPHVKRGWIKAIKAIRAGGGILRHTYMVEHPQTRQRAIAVREETTTERLPSPSEYYGTANPQYIITGRTMRQIRLPRRVFPYRSPSELRGNRSVSKSPASGGVDAGQWSEDEIAEAIFDWWISGKPYKKWYNDRYIQQRFNFD